MEVRPTGLPAESIIALQSGGPRRILGRRTAVSRCRAEYAKICRRLHNIWGTLLKGRPLLQGHSAGGFITPIHSLPFRLSYSVLDAILSRSPHFANFRGELVFGEGEGSAPPLLRGSRDGLYKSDRAA